MDTGPNSLDALRIGSALAVVCIAMFAVAAVTHALLNKRDPRSAFGWVALCLFFPLAGPVLYWLFGMNRIRTRARKLEQLGPAAGAGDGESRPPPSVPQALFTTLPASCARIAHVSAALTNRPLLGGSDVRPLYGGERAFPAMIEAIDTAERSVALTTYIFQSDSVGERFIDALARAHERGVDVRVIVDGFGELYALPRIARRALTARGVRVGRFLPPRLLPPSVFVNLRTHHKLLAVDGRVAFTGGMNISERHLALSPPPPQRAADVHFRVTGPVVAQLEECFVNDWRFVCRERRVPVPSSAPGSRGRHGEGSDAACRVVTDGPNESLDSLSMLLVTAIGAAERRITVFTPYFLPSRDMVTALQTAALRGVRVDVLLPRNSNLPYVDWAANKVLPELLRRGVNVHLQPPPFAHTKLFLVDEGYALIGSANLDPRSLRLNFELNVEVYGERLNAELSRYAGGVLERSSPLSAAALERRPVPLRMRDAAAWLFSPYL